LPDHPPLLPSGVRRADTERCINLRSLHEAMVALANFFDAVRMDMSVRLDHMGDAGGF
jgi:hypothetical protein